MIVTGILNKYRPLDYVTSLLMNCLDQTIELDHIFIYTDKKEAVEKWIDENIGSTKTNIVVSDSVHGNISEAKNRIISDALYINAQRLFIIEDDVEIHRNDTLEKYLALLNNLNIGVVSAGYTNKSNYVLTLPSPRLRFHTKDMFHGFNEIITNRHEVGDFILINLDTNKLQFDKSLDYFEFSEYIWRCNESGLIPGLNQFFDINDSWEYVSGRECDSTRKNDINAIQKDKNVMKKLINNEWKIENNVKTIMDYIINQYKEQEANKCKLNPIQK